MSEPPGTKRRRRSSQDLAAWEGCAEEAATPLPQRAGAAGTAARPWTPSVMHLMGQVQTLARQVTEEQAQRRSSEQGQARLEREIEDCLARNQQLEKAVTALEWKNEVLTSQVHDQSTDLAALLFETERARSMLRDHGVEPPTNLFEDARLKVIARSANSNPATPTSDACALQKVNLADFSSVVALVKSVERMQLSLRDSGRYAARLESEKVVEMESLVRRVENELHAAQAAANAAAERHAEEVKALSSEIADLRTRGRIMEEEMAISAAAVASTNRRSLPDGCDVVEARPALAKRVESLSSVVETQGREIAALRAENASAVARSAVAADELEYTRAVLARERSSAAESRTNAQALEKSLLAERERCSGVAAQLTTLTAELEVAKLTNLQKDREVQDWKQRLGDAHRKLEQQRDQAEAALATNSAKLSALEAAQGRAVDDLERCKAQVADLHNEVETLKLRELEAQERFLESEKTHSVEVVQLRSQLEGEQERVKNIEKTLKDTQGELLQEKERRRVATEKLALVEEQATLLKERYPDARFGVLEDQINEFNSVRSQLQLKVSFLEAENANVGAELQETKCESQQLATHVETLEARLRTKEAEVSTLTAEVAAKATLEDTQAAELKAATSSISTLQEKVATLEAKLTTAESEAAAKEAKLAESLEAMRRAKEEAEWALATAQGEASAAQQTLRLEVVAHGRDISECTALQKQLDDTRLARDQLVKEFTAQLAEKQALVEEMGEKNAALTATATRVTGEMAALASTSSTVSALLNEKIDALAVSPETRDQQVAELLRKTADLQGQVTRTRVCEEKMRLDRDAALAEVATLRKRLASAVSAADATLSVPAASGSPRSDDPTASYARKLVDLQLIKDQLDADLARSEVARLAAERRLAELSDEVEPIRATKARLQGESDSLRFLLDQARKDADMFRKKYIEMAKTADEKLVKEREALQKERDSAQEKAKTLGETLGSTKEMLAKTTADLTRSRASLDQANARAAAAEAKAAAAAAAESSGGTSHLEIQKRYQAQVSNMQRLFAGQKAERDALQKALLEAEQRVRPDLLKAVHQVLCDTLELCSAFADTQRATASVSA